MKKSLKDLFQLMYHGKHDFAEFMGDDVHSLYEEYTKSSGDKTRTIFVPSKKLKVFHTFLNLLVVEFLPINERVVFSYRKGFSAYDAVAPHTKSKYFFQADISAFFQSIKLDLVRTTVLSGAEACPASDVAENIDRILELVCVNGSLPVGFPCSAPISNSALLSFDDNLEEHCRSLGLIYTRYSDDIILSSNDKQALAGVESLIDNGLKQWASGEIQLNFAKSKHFQIGGKIKVLGMMILPNGKITIDSKVRRDLEFLLYNHHGGRELSSSLSDAEENSRLSRITGYLNYANSIDRDYVEKLRRRFGATTIDSLLHRPLPKEKLQK